MNLNHLCVFSGSLKFDFTLMNSEYRNDKKTEWFRLCTELLRIVNNLDSVPSWDLKFDGFSRKSREAQDLKGKLDKVRLGIETCYSKILKNDGAVSSTKLKENFLGMENSIRNDFLKLENIYSGKTLRVNFNNSPDKECLFFNQLCFVKL